MPRGGMRAWDRARGRDVVYADRRRGVKHFMGGATQAGDYPSPRTPREGRIAGSSRPRGQRCCTAPELSMHQEKEVKNLWSARDPRTERARPGTSREAHTFRYVLRLGDHESRNREAPGRGGSARARRFEANLCWARHLATGSIGQARAAATYGGRDRGDPRAWTFLEDRAGLSA